jgi:hypothetical protein
LSPAGIAKKQFNPCPKEVVHPLDKQKFSVADKEGRANLTSFHQKAGSFRSFSRLQD